MGWGGWVGGDFKTGVSTINTSGAHDQNLQVCTASKSEASHPKLQNDGLIRSENREHPWPNHGDLNGSIRSERREHPWNNHGVVNAVIRSENIIVIASPHPKHQNRYQRKALPLKVSSQYIKTRNP